MQYYVLHQALTVLSWHVQNFAVIQYPTMELH